MQRVLVCGITGVGKTTFARAVAGRSGLPYHEMDAMYHGPNWEPIPSFEDDVAEIVARPSWVFDSHGYEQVRDLMWSRADTIVWLDYPRRVVMRRVLDRSARRATTREPIFNGNVESFRDWLDPGHPVQWAWTQFPHRRADLRQRFASPCYAGLRKVRLAHPRAAERWLAVAT